MREGTPVEGVILTDYIGDENKNEAETNVLQS